MWSDFLFDPGTSRRRTDSVVDGPVGDGELSSFTLYAGEQVDLRLSPFPVVAENLQQPWRQRHVAILSAFTLTDMDHHSLTVDVFNLQAGKLGSPHARGIQRREHHAMIGVAGRLDEFGDFVLAQDCGQTKGQL